jgi:hypothetical protein
MSVSAAELEALVALIDDHPAGVAIRHLLPKGATAAQRKSMQRRLKRLAEGGRIVIEGAGSGTRYKPVKAGVPQEAEREPIASASGQLVPLTAASRGLLTAVRAPLQKRTPVSYRRTFLESYVPNQTHYLGSKQRRRLRELGQTDLPHQPAGTYAKQIFQRLIIDLAYHSSRLEGNTYSLLDTKRLLELGEAAAGRGDQDTQMILNHKDAIDFLVSDAEEVGFNRHTILNLHALLSNNLLGNPAAEGRLRQIPVAIGGSVYRPVEIPAVIEEIFGQVLQSASAISDPFEQAFFILVQLPYLQPFEDVNKRVSRLAANIPFIRRNLRPLSFVDVPEDLYTAGMLAVYEQNRIDLLRDVFLWAYDRSAKQYTAIRHALGEPDAFRLRHREAIRELVNAIIVARMTKDVAAAHIARSAAMDIALSEQEQFRQVVEDEIASLHEGNFVKYRVRPPEFRAWKKVWERRK